MKQKCFLAFSLWGVTWVTAFAPDLQHSQLSRRILPSSTKPFFRLHMVGSKSSNSKGLPRFQAKYEKSRAEKRKTLETLNYRIEKVEQQRIGLAKQIALAELERDRLQLEARRIAGTYKDSPGGELMSVTERATAKVSAYLEESRKFAAAVEAEKCNLLDEANECATEVADYKSDSDLQNMANPFALFGGFLSAAVGARMALSNRDEKQLETKQNSVNVNSSRVDIKANAIDAAVVEQKSEKDRRDTEEGVKESNHYSKIEEEKIRLENEFDDENDTEEKSLLDKESDDENDTKDLDVLLDDLQDAFDFAIREATQPANNAKVDSSKRGEFSFSWEANDTKPRNYVMNYLGENETSEQSLLNGVSEIETPDRQDAVAHVSSFVNPSEAPRIEIPRNLESRVDSMTLDAQEREKSSTAESGIPSVQMQKKALQDYTVFDLNSVQGPLCKIKVLGVGDSGAYSLKRLLKEEMTKDVELWAVNCDIASLGGAMETGAKVCFIGRTVTKGKGAEGSPEIGTFAAEESREDIQAMVVDSDVCIVTTGLGSGTGSGAAPVICSVAKDNGALTIAVVTKPFPFEGRKSMRQADDALDSLRELADAVIVVSNSNVLKIVPGDMSLEASFRVVDEIVNQVIVGLVDMLTKTGISTVDFADVNSVLKSGGITLMGMGTGSSRNASEDATIAAMTSPLLDAPLNEAMGILVNVVGGKSLSLQQIDRALSIVNANVNVDANVVVGAHMNKSLPDDAVSVTIIATSFKTSIITRYIRDYVAESPA